MAGHFSEAWLGAALAVTAAAALLAAGLPIWSGGLLVFLLAVLIAARWLGRTAGYVATVASVILAVLLLRLSDARPAGAIDAAAVALLGLLGAGIATWTGPRRAGASEPGRDPRRAKEEFLATVSHELRTPLNAILGWTELLRMPSSLPSQQMDRGLEVIERNARRQLALVEELLAAADPITSTDEWQAVDVRALMRAMLDGFAQRAATAQIALDDESPPGVPGEPAREAPVWVRGDPAGLRLALGHVLENAVKYTPAGGQVRTSLRQAGDRVLIFVTDTGPGIAPTLVERLFEPFQQQDGSTSRPHGGLGLGLTIARRLVERHGGHLDMRSDGPGAGSTFLITLPALPPA